MQLRFRLPKLLAVGLILGPTLCIADTVEAEEAAAPDSLELRNNGESHTRTILTLELASRDAPYVTFRGCEFPDAHDDCDGEWAVERRLLRAEELARIRKLAAEAQLFEGEASGRLFDFSYVSLEARKDRRVRVLVTSFNESFEKSGPRKDLLEALLELEHELARTSNFERQDRRP
jgi:hypothetical protein